MKSHRNKKLCSVISHLTSPVLFSYFLPPSKWPWKACLIHVFFSNMRWWMQNLILHSWLKKTVEGKLQSISSVHQMLPILRIWYYPPQQKTYSEKLGRMSPNCFGLYCVPKFSEIYQFLEKNPLPTYAAGVEVKKLTHLSLSVTQRYPKHIFVLLCNCFWKYNILGQTQKWLYLRILAGRCLGAKNNVEDNLSLPAIQKGLKPFFDFLLRGLLWSGPD